MTITEEQHKALRAPFPPAAVGKLPKLTCPACSKKNCQEHRKAKCNVCGNYISTAHIDLDYVGHAEVTDRLLSVDPEWAWEPFAIGPDGGPLVRRQGTEATLWIRLTVCGVTRPGVGSVAANAFDAEKQLVGDALRNAAMRFGVALDLWSKNELESVLTEDAAPAPPAESPIDCPEACGHTATKDAMRGHLLDAHGWQRHDDGRVSRPQLPHQGRSDDDATAEEDAARPGESSDGSPGHDRGRNASEPSPTTARAGKGEGPAAGAAPRTSRPTSPAPVPPRPPADNKPTGSTGAGPPAPLGTREEVAAEGAHPPAAASPGNVSTAQVRLIHVLLGKLGVGEGDKHRYCAALIDLPEPPASLNDLSKSDGRRVIDALQAEAGEPAK